MCLSLGPAATAEARWHAKDAHRGATRLRSGTDALEIAALQHLPKGLVARWGPDKGSPVGGGTRGPRPGTRTWQGVARDLRRALRMRGGTGIVETRRSFLQSAGDLKSWMQEWVWSGETMMQPPRYWPSLFATHTTGNLGHGAAANGPSGRKYLQGISICRSGVSSFNLPRVGRSAVYAPASSATESLELFSECVRRPSQRPVDGGCHRNHCQAFIKEQYSAILP